MRATLTNIRKQFQTILVGSLAFSLLGLASVAHGVAITVPNYSFEEPTTPVAGPFDPGSWSTTGIAGIAGPSISNASDGTQTTFIGTGAGAASVYQDIGALLPNTLYTLTVDIVSRNDTGFPGTTGAIQLFNGTNPSGTLLATSATLNQLAQNAAFQTYSITYTTGATVSGDLTINLAKFTGGTQFLYDNVRLDAVPVPEPSSLALLMLGSVALWVAKRKRSRS